MKEFLNTKELKHTPGPWYEINYAGYFIIQSKDGYNSSDVLDIEKDPKAKRNAVLCAAAPDLLEACIRAAEQITNHESGHAKQFQVIQEMLLNAINKATEL